MDPRGRTFVVTGAGSGIGREVARELLRRGATVLGIDISEPGLLGTAELVSGVAPGRFEWTVVDVSDHAAIREFAATATARPDGVDGLFNIAGMPQPMRRVSELSDDFIESIIAVNLLGPIRLARALLPHLATRPRAVIANTSSMSAAMPVPGSAVYAATKSALATFGEGLAFDLVAETPQVTLTTVLPGTVWTPLMARAAEELGASAMLARKVSQPADRAARRIIRATLRGRRRAPIGADARILDLIARTNLPLARALTSMQTAKALYGRAPGTTGPSADG